MVAVPVNAAVSPASFSVCWACCLASLAGVVPADVPSANDGFDLEEQNRWLARRGLTLAPVLARDTWGESYPRGTWIALLHRGGRITHAVLARGRDVIHDPAFRAGGPPSTLWPDNLAYTRNRDIPIGFELVAA